MEMLEQKKQEKLDKMSPEELKRYEASQEQAQYEEEQIKEFTQMRADYVDEMRQWQFDLKKAREYAQKTGDFTKFHALMKKKPIPPRFQKTEEVNSKS
jgi:hypothetical protein